MKIELVNEQNYSTLVEWYKGWDLPITPFSYIPRNSIIVDDVCAGFVYQLDNTSMWWIEGVVSNPSVTDKKLKKQALTILIKSLEDVVKANDGELIMTSTPRETLSSLFVEQGFNNTPEKYFHLARFI
jgi:hypothetical protein